MKRNKSDGNRHLLLMVLCCLVPAAALGTIFILRIPASQALTYGLILLCPLSHVLMMGLMGRGQHNQRAIVADRLGTETSVSQPTGDLKHCVSRAADRGRQAGR